MDSAHPLSGEPTEFTSLPVKNTFVHFPDAGPDLEEQPMMKTQSEGSRRHSLRSHWHGSHDLRFSSELPMRSTQSLHLLGISEASSASPCDKSSGGRQSPDRQARNCLGEEDACANALGNEWTDSLLEGAARPQAAVGSLPVLLGVRLDDTPEQFGQARSALRGGLCCPKGGSMTLIAERYPYDCHLRWSLPQAMIESWNCKVASPQFSLVFPASGPSPFQIDLYAAARHGPKCSQPGCPQGRVELRCLGRLPSDAGKTDFLLTVGAGRCKCPQWLQMTHDFSEKPRCNMRRWDLSSAVDPCTQTLTVDLCFGDAGLMC